jgi:RimJ/RimL family protein N-acetyltransferase
MADTIIDTPRLRLRNWDESDIAPFMAHLNTPGVMRWLGPLGDEAYYRLMYDRVTACQTAHGHCFWIVERKSDGELLGFCGLKHIDAPGASMLGDMEIGWRLREDAWGQGYAREAAEASLDYAFHTLDAPHVIALTVRQNSASWGLMQRLGMTRAPELDYIDERDLGGLENTIVYRIERRDWTQ